MKTKATFTLLLLLLIVTIDTKAQILKPTQEETLIAERFEYIRQIKKYVGNFFWKDFAANEFPGTISYFVDSATYFINPLPEMKEKVSSYAIVENPYDWNMWKLRMPFDSGIYVMETQFQFTPKSKVYINYKRPVLFCSSPELTKKEKPDTNSTQIWSVALMHELFHQYQYSNEAVLTYVLRLYQENKMIDMDSLQGIYRANQAYKDTLMRENDLLKQAIEAKSFEQEKKLFTQFLKLRAKRNKDYYKMKKFYVVTPESFWEKLEGTCLMMEKQLKDNFMNIPQPDYLVKNDPMYDKSFSFTERQRPDSKYYSDLDDKRFYVGATGFNMVQLLEKNKVPYKDNFFNYASLPLDLQLKYFYKIKL